MRSTTWANACVLICAALAASACAPRSSYQLPVESPPALAAGTSDAGAALPPPPAPARRGVIVPGDPAQVGTGSSQLETHTGTSGTRVTPGSSDGNH